MDWSVIIGIIVGIGSAFGAMAATEDYLSKKFHGAVKATLQELEIDRKLRHLEGNLANISAAYTSDVTETNERLERCKEADIRLHDYVQSLQIKLSKLESLVRLLAHDAEEQRSISAILDSQEKLN